MKRIRVAFYSKDENKENTIRWFKVEDAKKSVEFAKAWLKDGISGDQILIYKHFGNHEVLAKAFTRT